MFWNLIKNATKFTPRGGKITIRTWDSTGEIPGGEGPTLGAEVSDTGIGIEADRLPRIFNAFEERDPQRQRLYGGLGLGLAISRSVIQAHGGHLTASSAGRNRGATFRIELAAQPISRLDAPASDAGIGLDADGIRPEGLRILLVDDNRDTLRLPGRAPRATRPSGRPRDQLPHGVEAGAGATPTIWSSATSSCPTAPAWTSSASCAAGTRLRASRSADSDPRTTSPMSLESGFAVHLIKPIDVRALAAAIASVTAKHAVKDPACPRESLARSPHPHDHPRATLPV